jgi:quercetin dioxygenase-like cupin family protein
MKSFVVSLVAVGLLVACAGGTAATQATPTPPGPLTKYKNTLPGLNATGTIDLIQNVIDFGPGAASVVHTHSSPNLGTVLEGQITVKMPASDKRADAGGMLVEPINQPLQAVNTGSGEAMVVVAFAVPRGGKPTTPVTGRPAPAALNKTLYTFTLAGPGINGPYSLVQQVLDFAPGSQSLNYRYGGPGLFTVLQGQATLSSDGVEKTFSAGDTFTEMPFQTVQLFNRGTSDVSLAATFMLPDDAQLTTKP